MSATDPRGVPVQPHVIRFPRTSTRVQKNYAHLKLLRSVRRDCYSSATFEGELLKPGDNIETVKLGPNPVILECVGLVGAGQYRDCLWILWRYDWGRAEWQEVARAQSRDASWSLALREPAIRALTPPKPQLVDITKRSEELANKVMSEIDGALTLEMQDVQLLALDKLYNRIAGRLADIA